MKKEFHAVLIGNGNMGKRHWERLQQRGFIFDAVPDSEAEVSNYLLQENARRPLIIIASPSPTHFHYAQKFLQKKFPVFVEKPLALSGYEARTLQQLALKNETLLFTGHSERYHPVFKTLEKKFAAMQAASVSVHRENQATGKIYDTDVIFDLMIHDLYNLLILQKKQTPEIEFAESEDIQKSARVQLSFPGGFRANIAVSRDAEKPRRTYTFEDSAGNPETFSFTPVTNGEDALENEYRTLELYMAQPGESHTALETAVLAVETAERILDRIKKSRRN
ncbi:MAG: Gfo/Idh/MocA family oxidoreductase [Fibrobacter sp.]|nr:Gfo/Idh/MocA family oxidoreductase [Fibrobacter sp.]